MMRTFIIKARKGTTRWDRVRAQIGSKEHFEVVAHSVINAFFISNGFRNDVTVYIVLDSTEDFPRTITLSSQQGLSLSGFHEEAVVTTVEYALKESRGLQKNETITIAPGIEVSGFGLESLVRHLVQKNTLYVLHPKGENIRTTTLAPNPAFILSDHLTLPPKTLSGLKRQGIKMLSLGKKMLFASQCVVLLNHEIDLNEQ